MYLSNSRLQKQNLVQVVSRTNFVKIVLVNQVEVTLLTVILEQLSKMFNRGFNQQIDC